MGRRRRREPNFPMHPLMREAQREQEVIDQNRGRPTSSWEQGGTAEPPDAGVLEGSDKVVSFKSGRAGTSRQDHVLIRDGDFRDQERSAEFNRRGKHDHYGYDSRTGERFEESRGYHDASPYED